MQFFAMFSTASAVHGASPWKVAVSSNSSTRFTSRRSMAVARGATARRATSAPRTSRCSTCMAPASTFAIFSSVVTSHETRSIIDSSSRTARLRSRASSARSTTGSMRVMAVSGVRIWWDTSARESASALRSRDSWSRVRERRDTIFDSSLASTATSPSRQFEKPTVRPECSTSSISSASRRIWRWRYSDTARNTASSTAPVPATHGFASLGAAHASTAMSATMTAHWRNSVDAEPTLLAPSCRGGALHQPHDALHRPHGLRPPNSRHRPYSPTL